MIGGTEKRIESRKRFIGAAFQNSQSSIGLKNYMIDDWRIRA